MADVASRSSTVKRVLSGVSFFFALCCFLGTFTGVGGLTFGTRNLLALIGTVFVGIAIQLLRTSS